MKLVSMRSAGFWALIVICASLLATIVSALLFWLFPGHTLAFGFLVPELVGFMLPSAIVAVILVRKRINVLQIRRIRLGDAALVALMTVFSIPISLVISWLSSLVFPATAGDAITDSVLQSGPLLATLIIAVLPAICEESITRGVFLTGFGDASWWKACLFTAIFFGMIHMDFQQFVYVVPMGFLFALFVRATGSIFAGVIAHFINNGISVLMIFVQTGQTDGALYESGDAAIAEAISRVQVIVYTSAVAVSAVILALLLLAFIRRNKERLFAKPAAAPLEPIEAVEENAPPPVKDRALNLAFIIAFGIFLAVSTLLLSLTWILSHIQL